MFCIYQNFILDKISDCIILQLDKTEKEFSAIVQQQLFSQFSLEFYHSKITILEMQSPMLRAVLKMVCSYFLF